MSDSRVGLALICVVPWYRLLLLIEWVPGWNDGLTPWHYAYVCTSFSAEGREVTSHGSDGGKQTEEGGDDRERPLQPHQLAGPLCFAGDVCVRAAVSPCVCWTLGHLRWLVPAKFYSISFMLDAVLSAVFPVAT